MKKFTCVLLFVVFGWREKEKERKIKFGKIRSHRLARKLKWKTRISSVLRLPIQVYAKVESNGYSRRRTRKDFTFFRGIEKFQITSSVSDKMEY